MDMDTGSNMFQATNMAFARAFWYIIAGALTLSAAVQAVNWYESVIRFKRAAKRPTVPSNWFFNAWATATAVIREASYPQFYVPVARLTWLTPPPAGRIIALLIYWAIILYMLLHGAVIHDVSYWERIGFRAAWVTAAQLPLVYIIASKASVVGLVCGVGHERLNWLHRWVARTMLVTASVHGWHFYAFYVQADMFNDMLQMMPMIKYGLGAWAVILWSAASSLAPLRRWAYEVFVAQHRLAAIVLLWLVHVHIPPYARWCLWLAVAAFCFDRLAKTALLAWQNVEFRPNRSCSCCGSSKKQRFGHRARVRAVAGSATVVTVEDVRFRWRAGQHVYLWMPGIAPLESHPYTIATAPNVRTSCSCSDSLQLVVRKHAGFSRRLHSFAAGAQAAGETATLTAFVSGPYGRPPRWDVYETVVLIAASTGASFTLPILESVVLAARQRAACTKRVDFFLAARQADEIDVYIERLNELLDGRADNAGVRLSVHAAITRGSLIESEGSDVVETVTDIEKAATEQPLRRHRRSGSTDASRIRYLDARPDVERFVREAVEATGGETSVVVCGGVSLTARVRNCVAALSDDRAVHKGTGAQGIHLHVEEYSF